MSLESAVKGPIENKAESIKCRVSMDLRMLLCRFEGRLFGFGLVWSQVGAHFHSLKQSRLRLVSHHNGRRVNDFLMDKQMNLLVQFEDQKHQLGGIFKFNN
jgi:hypothetical protein